MYRTIGLLLALFLAHAPLTLATTSNTHALTPLPDQLLAQAIQAVREQRLDEAEADINRLIKMHPDFHLAHLVRGDILRARAHMLPTLGAANHTPASSERLTDLRDEAKARLQRHLNQPDPRLLPMAILQIAPKHPFVLLADTRRARLYLFENIAGEPRLLRDYYLSIGRMGTEKRREGDKRTPLGAYRITAHLSDKKLTDFYGAGAFPINYPNAWDRAQGRTGHGIWLHGVPSNTYSRAPNSSDGCLVVTNPDLNDLQRYIQIGQTPLIIAQRVEWLDRPAWTAQRHELLKAARHHKANLHHASVFLNSDEHLASLDLPAHNGTIDTTYLRKNKGLWAVVKLQRPLARQKLAKNTY